MKDFIVRTMTIRDANWKEYWDDTEDGTKYYNVVAILAEDIETGRLFTMALSQEDIVTIVNSNDGKKLTNLTSKEMIDFALELRNIDEPFIFYFANNESEQGYITSENIVEQKQISKVNDKNKSEDVKDKFKQNINLQKRRNN